MVWACWRAGGELGLAGCLVGVGEGTKAARFIGAGTNLGGQCYRSLVAGEGFGVLAEMAWV
jgi:hypothetical protein